MAKGNVKAEGPMVLPRAFSLLRMLAENSQGYSLSAIASHLDVPKSSLSSTLRALTDQGYIRRQGTLYILGSEAFSLASAILAGQTFRQIARPYLEQIREKTGETVVLAELDADQRNVIYVDAVESQKSVRFVVQIGMRRPLYAASLGRIFLANMPDAQREAYYNNVVLERFTETTISDRVELEKAVELIREKDMAEAFGQVSAEVAGFAAPIRNSDGLVVAAIAVGVPMSRAMKERKVCVDAVVKAGAAISRVLGYRPGGTG